MKFLFRLANDPSGAIGRLGQRPKHALHAGCDVGDAIQLKERLGLVDLTAEPPNFGRPRPRCITPRQRRSERPRARHHAARHGRDDNAARWRAERGKGIRHRRDCAPQTERSDERPPMRLRSYYFRRYDRLSA